ncbi:hypothetical protein Defa_05280 [Desulfovibrio sp. TH_2024_36128]|uniref:Lipoprotein n=1 Tax=Desulfovibrio falkowii TaxID=3136602 RepID=A0ABQ0E5Q9_9BACT
MNSLQNFSKPFMVVFLMFFLVATLPLLSGCKSEKEKQIEEQRERLLSPRKVPVDPHKAKGFDPYK